MNPRIDAQAIFEAAVARVDPVPMVERALRIQQGSDGRSGELVVGSEGGTDIRYDMGRIDRIWATGMGKASARMAVGLERVLGRRLTGGIIAVKAGHTEPLRHIRLAESAHPVPDQRSIAAADSILNFGRSMGTSLGSRDLVIVLVSGGGSSLLCSPAPGLDLADKIATTHLLLACGATINEVNCVRKHLSGVKGGRLAAALGPAQVLTLVLSDVIGDDLDAIASGPTVPDPTTFADALGIVERYGLAAKLPAPVLSHLRSGAAGGPDAPAETPKPGDPVFERTRTVLVGTNRLALIAAGEKAKSLGYHTLVLSSRLTGEARELAHVFVGIGKDIASSGFPLQRPACVIAGGESTVTLRGSGKGGRNQEMALAFLLDIGRSPKDGGALTFLSAGTDGNDGPTDAAGAVVDMELYDAALRVGLDPGAALASNDSYSFFSSAGGHLKTGPTNTNVCDVQVLLVT